MVMDSATIVSTMDIIPKELMKLTSIRQEKLALTRRELQEIVILTSRLTTQVGLILTTKTEHLFSSFGIKQAER